MTAVSYRDSRTDSFHRFSPVFEIQQKATAGPTAITNWTFREIFSKISTALACVCVCVCGVCVCLCRAAGQYSVTGLGFEYIMLYTDKFQVTGNPLFCHAFLCTRKYRILVQGKKIR